MIHQVRVVQVYRCEREIVLNVEADDLESAVEKVASGSVDVPSFDDEAWRSGYDLQNEEVFAA